MAIESIRYTSPPDENGDSHEAAIVKDGVEWFTSRGSTIWNEAHESEITPEPYVEKPLSVAAQIQQTDRDMARIGEDLIAHILETGALPTKADLDQGAIDKLNARRVLRGKPAI